MLVATNLDLPDVQEDFGVLVMTNSDILNV